MCFSLRLSNTKGKKQINCNNLRLFSNLQLVERVLCFLVEVQIRVPSLKLTCYYIILLVYKGRSINNLAHATYFACIKQKDENTHTQK